MADAAAEWLTVTDAAQLGRCSIDTIKRHGDEGRIPVTRAANGLRLFKRGDVERWARARAGGGGAARGRKQ
jgi:excisionase family DNA binding protein